MVSARERRERRKKSSTAKRRAQQHERGFSTSILKMPEGLSFFDMKVGIHTIDIVPFIAGEGNKYASAGELHYEKTFWVYRRIGAEEKNYVCPSMTFKKRDYIQEWRQKHSGEEGPDGELAKKLTPKERQLFLVYDRSDKKLKLWECSYYLFGELLDERCDTCPDNLNWDLFYYPDDDGCSLRITVKEKSGGGFSWSEVNAIDFVPRESPLPKEIVEHGICLDDILVEKSYEELKAIFLCSEIEESSSDSPPPPKDEGNSNPKGEWKDPSEGHPKAADYDLNPQDEVLYKGEHCTIAKISPDGTSLTLLGPDDDIYKAVSPEEVEKVVGEQDTGVEAAEEESTATVASTQEETAGVASSASPSSDDEDSWDF